MEVRETSIPGLLIIEPRAFGDQRGYFYETWNKERYAQHGITLDFVQDNLSFSRKGVLRGLHAQYPHAQGKLVSVVQGEVFDVAVDIRRGSPTFGKWEAVRLSAENKLQFWLPPGMAHGFCVLSETAIFTYKCTDRYSPETEFTLMWNDPDVGIEWPLESPQLSDKDQRGKRLRDLRDEDLHPFASP